MKSKNPAFENSLACLQHPLTLLSIAILLLNDHVLKVVSPSWVTGKLSDFAGLFFFPFIVAAGLSLALFKFNLSRQRIGQIAFGLVAVWFVLLKTAPLVNSLTAQFASLFIGTPARLILDPTDLIALFVMLPAWMLWDRTIKVKSKIFAYIALSIGALAAIASSGREWTVHNVTDVEYTDDGIVYAADRVTFNPRSYPVVQSLDGGISWEYASVEQVTESNLPIKYCSQQKTDYCVRVTVNHELMESMDSGEHWDRVQLRYIIVPNDLILFEWEGKEYIIVAIGEQGVLRREIPEGKWTQVKVESAASPLYSFSFSSALNVAKKEEIIWLGVAFLAILILQTAIWNRLRNERSIKELAGRLSHSILVVTIFIILDATLAYAVFLFLFGFPSIAMLIPGAVFDWLYKLTIVLAIIVPFTWLLGETNTWILKESPNDGARSKIVFYCVLTVIGVYLIGALPWPLWALGIIERYQWALFISISASVSITALGYRLIRNAK